MPLKHLELFSGVGGFRQALSLLSIDFGLKVETVGFSEIDKYASAVYKHYFKVSSEFEMGDITRFSIDQSNIEAIPNFDLLTAGFPCQPFSMMGRKLGFSDQRGTLFFHVLSILKIKKPRFVILENVRNLLKHDHGKTFDVIVNCLREIGYKHVYWDIFNSNSFGLAQKRNRLYVFAALDDPGNLTFSADYISSRFASNEFLTKTSLEKQDSTHDVLTRKVDSKYFLSEKIKPTILSDGSGNYHSKSVVNPMIAHPLTATMAKMHRACQDNYFTQSFIECSNPYDYANFETTKENLLNEKIRRITPTEAFRLQGFPKDFAQKAMSLGISDCQLYKQAGNAVSVNTVYFIMYYLFVASGLR